MGRSRAKPRTSESCGGRFGSPRNCPRVDIAPAALLSELTKLLLPAFHGAARFVPILILAYAFQSWTELVSTGLLIGERTGPIAVANYVTLVVAVAGYAILIPRWLGDGAAWATLLAFVVRFAIIYAWAQRTSPIAYRWGPVIRPALACAILSTLPVMMPTLGIVSDIAMRLALFTACAVAVLMLAIPDPVQRRKIIEGARSPTRLLQSLRGA